MAEKTGTEVVETKETTLPSTNLFGAKEGENFLTATLNQNFKQVRETQIADKSEDIQVKFEYTISEKIRQLKRKSRIVKEDLIKVVPSTPLQSMNLADLDEAKFVTGISEWRLGCHNDAMEILSDIDTFQSMFGKEWDEDDKKFVKSMVIDIKNV